MIDAKYPTMWDVSTETKEIWGALDGEVASLRENYQDFIAQCNVATATWGLDLWEDQVGLVVDKTKDADFRRSRILSKLRGTGTVTVAMIQRVAESFSNGEVEITEQPATYHFDIKFVGTIGIPPNMDDLADAIDDLKPAHLTYAFMVRFRTWAELGVKTWGQMAQKTWGQAREGTI